MSVDFKPSCSLTRPLEDLSNDELKDLLDDVIDDRCIETIYTMVPRCRDSLTVESVGNLNPTQICVLKVLDNKEHL